MPTWRPSSVDILSLYESGVHLYKRFYTVWKKNFEENMQEKEIDRDLFNAVPSIV